MKRIRLMLIVTTLLALLAAVFASLAPASNTALAQDADATLDPFPRPTNWDIVVAEQVFEGGRMFYLRPVERIWVLFEGEEETSGTWEVYMDEWEEGMTVSDPDLEVPDGLHQPIRGFGLLWRQNEDIRETLGWALDPEVGHMTNYRFFDDFEDEDGVVADYHTLVSTYGSVFIFNETDMTWELAPESVESTQADIEEAIETDAEAEVDEPEDADATEEPES